jgi:hypothetical protein
MKSISSVVVVLCGTAMLIAAATAATSSRDELWYMGFVVCVAGIAGWIYSLRTEK